MKIEISNRLLILLVILVGLAAYAYAPSWVVKPGIEITDAKMAVGLDDQFMPIQATDVFPRDTKRVFCWFSWDLFPSALNGISRRKNQGELSCRKGTLRVALWQGVGPKKGAYIPPLKRPGELGSMHFNPFLPYAID